MSRCGRCARSRAQVRRTRPAPRHGNPLFHVTDLSVAVYIFSSSSFFLCEPARGLLHYMCIYQSTIAEHRELGVTCILVARRLSFFTVSAGSVKRGDTESVESRDR
jgi:hypothetical protein